MIRLISIFLFVLCAHFANAQKVFVNKLTKYDAVATQASDVAFIRELTVPDSGYVIGLKEFYPNGKIKLMGSAVFEYKRMYYHGDVIFYDKNGHKEQVAKFEKGVQIAPSYFFYENGTVKKKLEYERVERGYAPDFWMAEANNIPHVHQEVKTKLMYFADSLGKVMVENGTGSVTETLNYLGEDFTEQGNYVAGRKHGEWRGKNAAGTKNFVEKYKGGKLITGTMSFNGKKHKYSTLFIRPLFGLANNHVLEAYLEKAKFQSSFYGDTTAIKSYIKTTVVVGSDGLLKQIHFLEDLPNQEVKQPIIDALMAMPKWVPATLRGLKVTVDYPNYVKIFTKGPKIAD